MQQDLSSNKLHKLSEGIAEIVKLEELVLAHNQLVELPKKTQLLTNLKILDAR
jgi:Leucine-rich repeat (LRR) protein